MNEHDVPATLTVKQTSQLLGLGIRATYRAVEAGHIPSIRLGRRILVPTARLYRMLGIVNPEAVRTPGGRRDTGNTRRPESEDPSRLPDVPGGPGP